MICLKLAMFKHGMDYEKDFLDTVEEDAQRVFSEFKRIYEEKKDTNASYIKNLEQIINYYGKFFD